MKKEFYEAVENRRSIYAISAEKVVPEERIEELVRFAVKETPTSFNVQSGRTVVLFDDSHRKLWDITKEVLCGIVPPDSFPATEAKLNSFRSGYGTVLYYEDQAAVRDLQNKFSLYRENFPVWSEQSSGILQYIVWSALEIEGLGATLQHYNPLIDQPVAKQWNIPSGWKLIGEMPFGKPVAPADAKSFLPLDERVRVYR